MRGYCGIGIYSPKIIANLGTLWRSAYCLGASFIYTIGDRYKHQCSDTTRSYKHIPYWRFDDLSDFQKHIPYDCQLVCIEIKDNARDLETFTHPQRAVYMLGQEDGSLPVGILNKAQHIVKFNSKYCLNVSSAGTVVLYDRQAKGGE